jgi:hypothetical protein
VDSLLIGGATLATVAKTFGVSVDAVARHKKAHVSPAQLAMTPATHNHDGPSTLEQVRALIPRAEGFVRQAEQRGAVTAGSNAMREFRLILELSAKLQGELSEQPTVSVNLNVLQTPEFTTLVSRLLRALEPYPEARLAAARALEAGDAVEVREIGR